ncbi:hypothetical protein ES711_08815 [Gelidibacter salicanalis]|uniref:Uncharacterized protein n=1 Tax=Gelidibacter salicanalis TaxID=291193 RepID=A0A5C7AM11_9FLAO|nr:hypothetical protein [Gelidibacter salicanalis]TXE08593.1 hypothetical protein ES711_08815 [Gelidibacter salicanalis]
MFTIKGAIFYVLGWVMLLGSSDLTASSVSSYMPVDTIVASQDHDHVPFTFDAVIDFNQSFTYEVPGVKLIPQPYKPSENNITPLNYQLSYYAIGQQIVVKLSTKAIIFPFHWFT